MTESNLEVARRLLRALETRDGTAIDCYADDAVVHTFPNRLVPDGHVADLAGIRAAGERGARAVADERYEVVSELAAGDDVALEVRWSARVQVPFGTLAPGDTMRAAFGVFMTFRDGRIVRHRTYDCFEPF